MKVQCINCFEMFTVPDGNPEDEMYCSKECEKEDIQLIDALDNLDLFGGPDEEYDDGDDEDLEEGMTKEEKEERKNLWDKLSEDKKDKDKE